MLSLDIGSGWLGLWTYGSKFDVASSAYSLRLLENIILLSSRLEYTYNFGSYRDFVFL